MWATGAPKRNWSYCHRMFPQIKWSCADWQRIWPYCKFLLWNFLCYITLEYTEICEIVSTSVRVLSRFQTHLHTIIGNFIVLPLEIEWKWHRTLTLNPAGFHVFAPVPVSQTGCRGSPEQRIQVVSTPPVVHSVLRMQGTKHNDFKGSRWSNVASRTVTTAVALSYPRTGRCTLSMWPRWRAGRSCLRNRWSTQWNFHWASSPDICKWCHLWTSHSAGGRDTGQSRLSRVWHVL